MRIAVGLLFCLASVFAQQNASISNLTLIERNQFQQNISTSGQGQPSTVGQLLVFGMNPMSNLSTLNTSNITGNITNFTDASGNLNFTALSNLTDAIAANATQVATIGGVCWRIVQSNATVGANVTAANQTGVNQTQLLPQFPLGNMSDVGLSMCQQTYAFSQLDTLQADGLVRDTGASILSIVGGTGRFVNVIGGYVLQVPAAQNATLVRGGSTSAVLVHQIFLNSSQPLI